ncbi:biotin--[acetyl-CoA-carboxylase] ligase [Cyanobium sp. NS01]|uniref:biotin--[acetyl-CoA-carboxylase] ligase n=1 Tax=Cyanobium sp. NS01 TaxID=261284 RepID=UPI0016469082|nr:biotin--[acetyl-CoA-carboxylase] ligase [Cyanobium sp. NS01]QNI71352.1 biotin operon repressor / biotin-[acetyl-CoA-carboxylase] ligase [Cyanobium sp. NS01]
MSGWQIRRLPVCASTEWELDRWLRHSPPGPQGPDPWRAVVARRQRHGQGQRGRPWCAPAGGVWLSAAFPWPGASRAPANLPLALAVGLARELEGLGLPVRIKWPNDLLVHGGKLAGLLPRQRWRGGRLLWAQAGIGLNGTNRVPPGAVSVAQALARSGGRRGPGPGRWHPQACPRRLEARVWSALRWAMAQAGEAELVRDQAEQRLWQPPEGVLVGEEPWQVAGLELDGRLRLQRGVALTWLSRSF